MRRSVGLLESENTEFLRFSYFYSTNRNVEIGERLYVSAFGSPQHESVHILTEWVAIHVERFEPDMKQIPGLRDVLIAYCESQPLTTEDFKKLSYSSKGRVTVDSFGGDENTYKEWITTQNY